MLGAYQENPAKRLSDCSMVQVRRGFKTWCENAARGYRRELGLDPFAALDPRVLANHLGITVWTPSDVPGLEQVHILRLTTTEREMWSAVTLRDRDRSLIILNDGHSKRRQNNSLCHEIGHIALKHVAPMMILSNDGLMMMTEYDPILEEEATIFAGAILAPREALLKKIDEGMTAPQLASYFEVTEELIAMRKNTTGIGFQLARRQRGTWVP
jgi:IrrE N-terminal-like domain